MFLKNFTKPSSYDYKIRTYRYLLKKDILYEDEVNSALVQSG